MSSKNPTSGLIASIIFASVVVSGSLVFFGMQFFKGGMDQKDFQKNVYDSIDQYIADKQNDAAQKQIDDNKPVLVKGDFADNDAVQGKKDALVTIVEFSDYQCPYCSKFFNEALPQIRSSYIATGKAKLIYRDYPLSFHPNAYPAALFAECVRDQTNDETYFKVHDFIFQNIAKGFNFDKYSEFAVANLGVDKTKLKSCFDSDKFKAEIAKDESDGVKAGVGGTPAFLINGWLVSGAQPFPIFQKVIDGELAKVK